MRWTVDADDAGRRLDVYVGENAEITRSRAISLIKEGHCLVDGRVEIKGGACVRQGQTVELEMPETTPSDIVPQNIPLDIIYQDADLAVIFKPSGMVVHPAAGNPDGTLVNALLYHIKDLSGIGGCARPGIVHRIDKDTSGLLLVAKNDFSHVCLCEQIKEHTLDRAYHAIVSGCPKKDAGLIDAPIGRHPVDRKRMAIVRLGREAQTAWTVMERYKNASLIEARLKTGRTHQIRVHMASIGHPVLGDPLYAFKNMPYNVEGGQLLHAFKLGFTHPSTGERMIFTAQPEKRFKNWLEKLRASV
ncbi:MAG: RluA family pseudouridine synthase [Clostridia bacterium]|nr:RluA family pseudouridine synthase [Clostridia bacterium]